MKMQMTKWLALLLMAILATGCSTMGGGDEDTADSGGAIIEDGSGSTSGDASTSGMTDTGAGMGTELNDPNSPLYTKVIYFDFDQATIREDSIDTLRAHANYLVRTGGSNVIVEGHCDERGSREYNIALGERRANVVKEFLQAEGVSESQIDTISYGEERSANDGHSEEAWAENRRAALVY